MIADQNAAHFYEQFLQLAFFFKPVYDVAQDMGTCKV